MHLPEIENSLGKGVHLLWIYISAFLTGISVYFLHGYNLIKQLK